MLANSSTDCGFKSRIGSSFQYFMEVSDHTEGELEQEDDLELDIVKIDDADMVVFGRLHQDRNLTNIIQEQPQCHECGGPSMVQTDVLTLEILTVPTQQENACPLEQPGSPALQTNSIPVEQSTLSLANACHEALSSAMDVPAIIEIQMPCSPKSNKYVGPSDFPANNGERTSCKNVLSPDDHDQPCDDNAVLVAQPFSCGLTVSERQISTSPKVCENLKPSDTVAVAVSALIGNGKIELPSEPSSLTPSEIESMEVVPVTESQVSISPKVSKNVEPSDAVAVTDESTLIDNSEIVLFQDSRAGQSTDENDIVFAAQLIVSDVATSSHQESGKSAAGPVAPSVPQSRLVGSIVNIAERVTPPLTRASASKTGHIQPSTSANSKECPTSHTQELANAILNSSNGTQLYCTISGQIPLLTKAMQLLTRMGLYKQEHTSFTKATVEEKKVLSEAILKLDPANCKEFQFFKQQLANHVFTMQTQKSYYKNRKVISVSTPTAAVEPISSSNTALPAPSISANNWNMSNVKTSSVPAVEKFQFDINKVALAAHAYFDPDFAELWENPSRGDWEEVVIPRLNAKAKGYRNCVVKDAARFESGETCCNVAGEMLDMYPLLKDVEPSKGLMHSFSELRNYFNILRGYQQFQFKCLKRAQADNRASDHSYVVRVLDETAKHEASPGDCDPLGLAGQLYFYWVTCRPKGSHAATAYQEKAVHHEHTEPEIHDTTSMMAMELETDAAIQGLSPCIDARILSNEFAIENDFDSTPAVVPSSTGVMSEDADVGIDISRSDENDRKRRRLECDHGMAVNETESSSSSIDASTLNAAPPPAAVTDISAGTDTAASGTSATDDGYVKRLRDHQDGEDEESHRMFLLTSKVNAIKAVLELDVQHGFLKPAEKTLLTNKLCKVIFQDINDW